MKFKRTLFGIIIAICIFFITIFISTVFQIKVLNKEYANIFNKSLFIISSGSMQPTLDIGDDVLVDNTKENININDIIVYKDETSDMLVCHRVINIEGQDIVCKGDNNNVEDRTITKNQIVGKVVKIIPRVGKIQFFLRKPWIIIILIDTLLIYIILSVFFPKKKDKNQKK